MKSSPTWHVSPPPGSAQFVFETPVFDPSCCLRSYIGIPQTQNEMKKLMIHTLSSYCSTASAFIVIAPIATHQQTGTPCNFTSYQTRMWTRAEQFCHAAVKGVDSMWIATSEEAIDKMGSHKLLSMGNRWMTEILHVFEGTATDDVDKLVLIAPLLGLYAELYACADDIRSDPTAPGNQFLNKMLETIEGNKDTIFPARTKIQSRPSVLKPSRSMRLDLSPQEELSVGDVVLAFGDLVSSLEQLLDHDDELRSELRAAGLTRRGLTAKAATRLNHLASRKTFISRSRNSSTRFARRTATDGQASNESRKTAVKTRATRGTGQVRGAPQLGHTSLATNTFFVKDYRTTAALTSYFKPGRKAQITVSSDDHGPVAV